MTGLMVSLRWTIKTYMREWLCCCGAEGVINPLKIVGLLADSMKMDVSADVLAQLPVALKEYSAGKIKFAGPGDETVTSIGII
jgi:hypothetical protein